MAVRSLFFPVACPVAETTDVLMGAYARVVRVVVSRRSMSL